MKLRNIFSPIARHPMPTIRLAGAAGMMASSCMFASSGNNIASILLAIGATGTAIAAGLDIHAAKPKNKNPSNEP